MNCPIIDTHCHLSLYKQPEYVAKKMERQNGYIISMSNLPSQFLMSQPFVKSHKKIRLSLGMHPLLAKQHTVHEQTLFTELKDSTSYIGEVGLDFSKEGKSTSELQIKTFTFVLQQIKNKPKILSLHSRGAEKVVLELLKDYKISFGVFHWYSGGFKVLDLILDAGYYFSVNPYMISSKKGKEIISRIPKDRILTETDGPNSKKSKELEPIEIEKVINYLANHWEMSMNSTTCQIYENFKHIVEKVKSMKK